eukprot:scaffold42990_cov56-Attheya_sp.AAC.5
MIKRHGSSDAETDELSVEHVREEKKEKKKEKRLLNLRLCCLELKTLCQKFPFRVSICFGLGLGLLVFAQVTAFSSDLAARKQSISPRVIKYSTEWRPPKKGKGLVRSSYETTERKSFDTTKRKSRKVIYKHGHISKYEFRDSNRIGNCVPQYEWQEGYFPTCSFIHEANLDRFLANGHYRDVFGVQHWGGEQYAMKTLRWQYDFDHRHFDRNRRDAIIAERLTASPYVSHIYGHCANSAMYEFSSGEDLYDAVEEGLSRKEILRIATDAANALAHTNYAMDLENPVIAHTDIKPDQFILTGSSFKLNDFNRGKLLLWDTEKKKPCGFKVGKNGGRNRSPEEYLYVEETEKVDIYSLGNIFYFLLVGERVYSELHNEEVYDLVKRGERAPIPSKFTTSDDPVYKAIIKAIKMCWIQDPEDRATSKEVAKYLTAASNAIFSGNYTI